MDMVDFFFLFCQNVIEMYGEERLNELRIELVDNDENVDQYHQSIFRGDGCDNVFVIKKDITVLEASEDVLLYLNFCGISESLEKVKKYLEKMPENCSIMISYSIARSAKKKKLFKEFKWCLSRKTISSCKIRYRSY